MDAGSPRKLTTRGKERRRQLIDEAARLFAVSRKTIRNLLSEHRAAFDPPCYGRIGDHPRRLRLLSPRDLTQLDHLLSVHLSSRLSSPA